MSKPDQIEQLFKLLRPHQKDQETALECLERMIKDRKEQEEWFRDKVVVDGSELFNNRKPHEALNLLIARAKFASGTGGERGAYWAGIVKSLKEVGVE